MKEKVLKLEELASVLRVNPRTIRRELERENCRIPYQLIGSTKRFILSEVLKSTAEFKLNKGTVTNWEEEEELKNDKSELDNLQED